MASAGKALRMFPAIVAVLLALSTGCSSPAPAESPGSVPGKDNPGRDEPSDAAAKPKQGDGRPGTVKEEFMPVLEKAYGRVSWPPAFTMTTDRLWDFLAAGAADTAYSETDAVSMVTIWNTCAWTLQLVDDTKAGRPVDADVAKLESLGGGAAGELVRRIVADAKLGELATARQFITANDCEKGFPR